MTRPPKLILVIVGDQLRADHLGFGGMELAHTPNLDTLAATGTVFDRAHVTNPICMPSRATLATGRWPSVHGTRTNGVPLDPTAETVMSGLRRSGWHTAAVGKLHLQTMGWPAEDFQLAEIAATNPESIDPALVDARGGRLGHRYDWEDLRRHRDELVEMPDDYYGFASSELVVGHGDRASGHYAHWLKEKGVDPAPLAGHANSAFPSRLWDQVWTTGVPVELGTSAFVAERTVNQINAAATREGPTFIFASFPDPHHPFCPPPAFAGLVSPQDIPLPSTFHQAPEGLPAHIQYLLAHRGTPHADPMFSFAATEEQFREAMVAEIGLMATLDAAVGQMLTAITAAGLADQTTIVFTADHGDMFGDHGLMLKHHVHYEGVTRVPLVIAGQGARPHRTDALVSNADIVPTIFELAGVAGHRGIQGRSLVPVLDGSTTTHRDAVLIEEDQPFGATNLPGPVRIRTLITDEGRLTIYHGTDEAEFYNHLVDPLEEDNRHRQAESAALVSNARDRMLCEVLSLADEGSRVLHGA
ncbi:MAG: sulfatase-like hydrolase/transferase [Acidimicrobiales bacterium]